MYILVEQRIALSERRALYMCSTFCTVFVCSVEYSIRTVQYTFPFGMAARSECPDSALASAALQADAEGGGSVTLTSREFAALRHELLTEMRRELHKFKADIIDGVPCQRTCHLLCFAPTPYCRSELHCTHLLSLPTIHIHI